MIRITINTILMTLTFALYVNAQNPIGYTAERTDNSGATLNLKNVNGFWHFSGPRSYEQHNKLSIFWNDGTYHRIMSINDNGNVGIGTTVPYGKLDVRGCMTSSHNNGHKVNLLTSGDGNSYLNFVGGASNSRIGFQIDGSSKMSIYNNGSVAIGTGSTGTHKLAVEGSIGAREVKVEVGTWSDYVFETDYDLPTLEEVEKHIKEKGHLINIPSAKEVEENGIELGEMNKLLLEKIEELTLYTLEQEKKLKRMKSLELELELQSKAIEELKAEIKKLKK